MSRPTNSPRNGPQRNQPQKDLMAIDAPYNFVPLAEQVVTPDWAPLVSHDLPFKDGLSGTIEFTLTAHTPLLVGGTQTKATEREPGVVMPFQTPDGNYAIPGSSLKGMLRAVLEIATFSRMQAVDDKRYGLRDISGKYVADAYTSRVRNRVKAGFLRLNAQGEQEIVPCSMARLSHRDLEEWWHESAPIFKKGERIQGKYELTTVSRKYAIWERLCRKHKITAPFKCQVEIMGETITAIDNGSTIGFPVFTGQINDCTNDQQDRNGKWIRGKYKDFVFYSPREQDRFLLHEIDAAAWRDFLFIHWDEGGKPDMPWHGHWKGKFWAKQPVPVFYIQAPGRLQIGLAYMPKLAGDFSIHDMIKHSSPQHAETQQQDFASLIFGDIDDRPNASLKGRVWCELATVIGCPNAEPQPATILSSPHPTYFPNYIQQPVSAKTQWKLSGPAPQYATYLDTPLHHAPKLRGWKRYPARPKDEVAVQELSDPDQQQNHMIQIRLHTLPQGTQFACRMLVHNLKPVELGAVIWSLTFGDRNNCQHRLGLAKSFGFGQVSLQIDTQHSQIISNDTTQQAPSFADCVQVFQELMTEKLGTGWEQTPQISALLAMADPAQRQRFPGQLKHMVLAQFLDAKKAGLVLASYNPTFPQTANASLTANTPHSPATPKHSMSLAPPSAQTWTSVVLTYDPGKGTISANQGINRASSDPNNQTDLLKNFDEAAKKRLRKGKLKATLGVEHQGGSNWKIIKIDTV